MVASLRDGRCDGLIERDMLVQHYLSDPDNCDLVTQGPVFWRQNLGVGIRKDPMLELFRDQLSLWTVRVRAANYFSELDSKYLTASNCQGTHCTSGM